MDERVGTIVFINSHDYVSRETGEKWAGCLSAIRADDGHETLLYTESLRLQHTLEMAFASGRKFRVRFWPDKSDRDRPLEVGNRIGGLDGPYILKAIWTAD